jgi:hypothetical protein
MKTIPFVASVLAALAATLASAADQPVKTCSTVLSIPGETKKVPTRFEIFQSKDGATAKVTQTIDGRDGSYEDTAEIAKYSVRPGLSAADAELSSLKKLELNDGEEQIARAMEFLENPSFKDAFSAGLDLEAVRSVKVFSIGKMTHMGGTVIVEAYDADTKNLGSFLTGFMIFACARD